MPLLSLIDNLVHTVVITCASCSFGGFLAYPLVIEQFVQTWFRRLVAHVQTFVRVRICSRVHFVRMNLVRRDLDFLIILACSIW